MIMNYRGYTAIQKGTTWFIYSARNQSRHIMSLINGTQIEVKQNIDGYIQDLAIWRNERV